MWQNLKMRVYNLRRSFLSSRSLCPLKYSIKGNPQFFTVTRLHEGVEAESTRISLYPPFEGRYELCQGICWVILTSRDLFYLHFVKL